jgi:hypothetical protein
MGFREEIYCLTVDKVPAQDHWAVLVNSSYVSPGWNSGETDRHSKLDYIAFAKEDDLKTWISTNMDKVFKVIRVSPKTFKQEIIIQVTDNDTKSG